MRIELTRSGGFGGLIRTASIDTATLPPEEADDIEALVAAVDLEALTRSATGPAGPPDTFQYRLQVAMGSDAHHASFGERAVTPALRALLQRVLARAGPGAARR